MQSSLFNEFLESGNSLRVYQDGQLLFSSNKDRVLPLIEYIEKFADSHQQVTILDKIMGNAAALLSVKAGCGEVYSPLGSQLAIETLEKYGIKHHITRVVPYIQKATGEEMCPMEALSINKDPEECYQAFKSTTR